MATSPVELALTRWRNNLIDLSRRNPLLGLKPTRSAYLEITRPDAASLFHAFVLDEKAWTFFLPPPPLPKEIGSAAPTAPSSAPTNPHPPRATELVTHQSDRERLLQTLTNLHRRARADFRERGLHILHLACGILEWRDPEDEPFRSPLLLVPVELERHSLREPFQLKPTADDPWLNPALAARLKLDFDFRLPEPPEHWEDGAFVAYLKQVEEAVAGLPGWQLKAEAVLAPFSFYKGVIYQDLSEHAAVIQEHPLVQSLAGVSGRFTTAEPLEERQLDEQDPRAALHILDADASQRLALDAAARGASFVLIGPPGTGKSQTIANLIADQIAQGRKVLFVSEKMAALEVVEQRLRRAGLGDCLLELHSHKANKRAVVTELARTWQDRQRPQAPVSSAADGARLRERQQQLNAYVRALHQRREPIGKSAWDVLADLPRWRDLPALPLDVPLVRDDSNGAGGLVIAEITAPKLEEITKTFQRAQSLWRFRNPDNAPWTGFKADRFTLQLRDEIAGLLDKAQQRGDKLVAAAEHIAEQLDIGATSAWLLRLGEVLDHRPAPVPSAWLFDEDLDLLTTDVQQATERYRRLREGRNPLTVRYGPNLWKLEAGTAGHVEATWHDAARSLAPGDDAGAKLLAQQKRLRGWAADTQKRLPTWHSDLRALERWLGLTLPPGGGAAITTVAVTHDGFDPAPHTLKLFLRLTHLCHSDHPTERSWITDPDRLRAAQEEIAASGPEFLKYRQGKQKILERYTEDFFTLELDRIAAGYEGAYQSWFRFLNRQYRRDRRALARRSRTHETPATVAEDVLLGRDVVAAKGKLEGDSPRRWQKLGRYERGLDTDLDAAEKATRVAAEALDLARQIGAPGVPDKLTEALCSGAPPEKIRAAIHRLQESFGAWWHETQELAAVLPMGQLPGSGTALDEAALSAVMAYARELQTRLNPLAAWTDPVLQAAKEPPTDLATLVADLRGAEELLRMEAEQETEARALNQRFGGHFRGADTDWDKLSGMVAWARRLRETWNDINDDDGEDDEPAESTATFLAVAAGEQPAPSFREFRTAHEQFRQSLHVLETRFDAPGPLLDGKPWREQPDEDVLEHVESLREHIGELADWVEWRQLPERCWRLGLAKFWHALTQLERPDAPLADLFQKAFWSRWLEWVFQEDPVLANFRRDEHERTLQEFRDLDRQILHDAPQEVLRRVAAQNVAFTEPEVALLMKEAHKKTRHLPLRRLFEAAPRLLVHLKPCLLMSPLSVSQFLPADPALLHFDLVIFDEASQIVPEDAIGAITRGKQIVVTGDNRQLPPTTFFQQVADEGEETEEDPGLFESVLDACLGAGMPQRWLRWHYRSRHEHLIAFANERIYDNRLVTFPGAVADHPDLGVHFRHVPDGRYDRGGRRDNPREAQVVADLVVDSLRRQPEKSVGVIAFSYPQMDAIEDELERRLAEAPELEKYLAEDRLEGLFIKNLETVQGDERDVIFLSVGYGPDADGKVVLNFGPINRQGGERRLNVAVTRARQKLVVVSSIRARDIAHASSKGIQFLQQYLDYAEHGVSALRPGLALSADAPPAHALEADVRQVLRERGITALPRVGCASYRVDIAVVDPKQPGRYVLGIEFDGPHYEQAGTARDRDRLRHEVMERLGWKLHRIWAPSWMLRRGEEVERLLKEAACGLA